MTLLVALLLFPSVVLPQSLPRVVVTSPARNAVPLASTKIPIPLLVSSSDYPGVLRVVRALAEDLGQVTGTTPAVRTDSLVPSPCAVIAGTIGHSPLIDRLIREGTLDVAGVRGRWESAVVQTVDAPLPGIQKGIVVAGSDKRGTIFALYELSAQSGVSPWVWWADVPPKHHAFLAVKRGRHVQGSPAVQYRGFFINDEAPALSGWSKEKFGGFNHTFYEKVFDLLLRLKGNFLWPAMWGNAFAADDSLNPRRADEFGVVMGTSHHEPMMRAHAEWGRGPGTWDYAKNADTLRAFWRRGVERMGSYESLVTIGMRGDGDEPMSEKSNIALLERIVRDQRAIIADVTRKPAEATPQVWALYKEVQDYYDKGMRVPDDVTLLLCDDNWGNIRKLPKLSDPPRTGGYGIYYHFDYVGGPRNYKWLNTNQVARVWEQMHLAYAYGARKLWIVNVGDIKPMEYPLSFFLSYAWDPANLPAHRIPEYARTWAEQQFGPDHAAEIADILTAYTKYNARRKPELITPETFSLLCYREAERVRDEYAALTTRARAVGAKLPALMQDAYFQLVLHPVEACANLYDLYVTTGLNRLAAAQGRSVTNALADSVAALFRRDAEISARYNTAIAGGKWHHMMDQTHIGYTSWQQPDSNAMPSVRRIVVPASSALGVAVEGSASAWPGDSSKAMLPLFASGTGETRSFIEVFNRGSIPFPCTVRSASPGIEVAKPVGPIRDQQRLWVRVIWAKTPMGRHEVPITITGPQGQSVVVTAVTLKRPPLPSAAANARVECQGAVTVEAEHWDRAVGRDSIGWLRIPDLGRTLSGIEAVPVTVPAQVPGGDSPRLEYRAWFTSTGPVTIQAMLSPTLDFHNGPGLRYAMSVDDEAPRIVNMHQPNTLQNWERWVASNVIVGTSLHEIATPGLHRIKFWLVDPGVVLQRLVVWTGAPVPTYLGPRESPLGSEVKQ